MGEPAASAAVSEAVTSRASRAPLSRAPPRSPAEMQMVRELKETAKELRELQQEMAKLKAQMEHRVKQHAKDLVAAAEAEASEAKRELADHQWRIVEAQRRRNITDGRNR